MFSIEVFAVFSIFVTSGIYVIIGKSRGIPCHFTLGYLHGPIDKDLSFYGSAMLFGSA